MHLFLRELRPLDFAIIGLTILTAVIHFTLAQPLFILNGIGYLGLLGAIYLPWPSLRRWQRAARWGLLGYAALTIVLYFVAHADGSWMEDGLGIMTKMVELILVLLLLWEQQDDGEET